MHINQSEHAWDIKWDGTDAPLAEIWPSKETLEIIVVFLFRAQNAGPACGLFTETSAFEIEAFSDSVSAHCRCNLDLDLNLDLDFDGMCFPIFFFCLNRKDYISHTDYVCVHVSECTLFSR